MATSYSSLPASWSNKKQVERLRKDAYESLTRMLARAVADTGSNFSIWSALRTKADQVALFKANYSPTSRGRKYSTDRAYAGRIWARKSGGVSVASPDLGSNHQGGVAVDIHPAAIQNWIKKNGLTYGWSWAEGKRVGENWHFRYLPAEDKMKSEGKLDHAWVQKVVGASVDGKIGTGTVSKIKAWQKAHGLTADGKVGAKTKAAMLGKAVEDTVTEVVETVEDAASSLTIAELPAIETDCTSANVNKERFGESVKHITIHWWGSPVGQKFEGIRDYLVQDRGNSGTSAHYICEAGRVARIVPEEWTAWANGNRTANRQGISIECNPNDVIGTLPTLAALVKDIRSRYGDLPIYPHQHWTATECPGDYIPYLDALDKLARTGKAAVDSLPTSTPVVKPSTGSSKPPNGKALLMAIIDAPDFPLLRTPGNKCFYGPATAKLESVSGHKQNSLNPGEITGGCAQGLKTWQKQMRKRGYSITADGKYGNETEAAAKNLQKLAGITQDGLIGPDAWYAAWVLPVVK